MSVVVVQPTATKEETVLIPFLRTLVDQQHILLLVVVVAVLEIHQRMVEQVVLVVDLLIMIQLLVHQLKTQYHHFLLDMVMLEEDLVELSMMGIDLFQGFLLARPHAEISSGTATAELAVASHQPLLRERVEVELDRRRELRLRDERVVSAVAAQLVRASLGSLELTAADVPVGTSVDETFAAWRESILN